jgi:hypothetical protein
MSLKRLVYYSAVIGGWAAFVGWLISECLILRGQGTRGGLAGLAVVGGIIGAAIGAGLNVVAGWSNTQWKRLWLRVLSGLIVGGAGGALGILVGNLVYTTIGLPRALGFMILGLGVGVVDGLYERSGSKIRNGVIGGLFGGLVGGVLFDPLNALIASGSGISSRATAFVILGICIGALIGLAQVVLKEAWLTVLDGYRPGRQLILSQPMTILGRADHLPLPFIGPMNVDLDAEHLRIIRQSNGAYVVEDNNSKLGVSVNHQVVQRSRVLANGDVIKLGTNYVRFNERKGKSKAGEADGVTTGVPAPSKPLPKPPPPPPAPKTATGAGKSAAKPAQASVPKSTTAIPPLKAPTPNAKTSQGGPPPPPPPPPRKSK